MDWQLNVEQAVSTATILFDEAEKRGLRPEWETDYGLFSFEKNGNREYLFFSKMPFNNQLSAEFTNNKHFTHIILDKAGFETIPFCAPQNLAEAEQFLKAHHQIVIKPTKGRRARGVTLITTPSQLKILEVDTTIIEKYIPGTEFRYLILFNNVIGVMKKELQPLPHRPWHKLNEAIPKSEWNRKDVDLALKITETLQLNWCAVDFIVDKNQKSWILEVNSAPGINIFHAPHKGLSVDIAAKIFDELTR